MQVAPHPEAPKVEYFPNGYPQIGLTARTLPLKFRTDANLLTLRKRLERWERAQGNHSFRARNLEKIPKALAFELVHVYVALRERFPDVQPDYIDFRVENDKNTLAYALSYSENYPMLRRIASDLELELVPLERNELYETAGEILPQPQEKRAAVAEAHAAWDVQVGNLFATGSISFGDVFATKTKYQGLLNYWARRNANARAAGRPLRQPPVKVSAASMVFIHEFGHLVEAELMQRPYRQFEKVYDALTTAVLGQEASPNQWRYHLVNYPTYSFTKVRGAHVGSKSRQRATRKALRRTIADTLGTYAPSTREELFAEAFTFSLTHAQRSVRSQLDPLQASLKDCGLRVRRLPNRRKVA